MAHGAKRWITRYDGRIVRSNDRTKLDYYSDLRFWTPVPDFTPVWGNRRRHLRKQFCPQCKHNLKIIEAHNKRYHDAVERLRVIFVKDKLEAYKKAQKKWLKLFKIGFAKRWEEPQHPGRSHDFWKFVRQHELPPLPIRDDKTFLCPKHRRMSDLQDQMWHSDFLPGRNRGRTSYRRTAYKKYRSRVKNQMRNGKYDDEIYENISVYGDPYPYLD